MKLDALYRRRRDAPPQPTTRKIILDPDADGRGIFLPIAKHGPLPTPYLHISRTPYCRNETHNTKRLTHLFNGYCPHPEHKTLEKYLLNEDGEIVWTHTCKSIHYTTRPWKQFFGYHRLEDPLVHGLTPLAEKYLDELDLLPKVYLKRSGSFAHDLFLSCFTFSFEQNAKGFIFRDEYAKIPIGDVYPDDLFGDRYEEGKARYYALEIDMATEQLSRVEAKLKGYERIMREREYEQMGIKNINVLFATTKRSRVEHMLSWVQSNIEERFRKRFFFKSYPIFGGNWRIPSELLETKTWRSVNGVADISGQV